MSLDQPPTQCPRNGAGSAALVFGMVAFVCAFIPVIGELVTVPAAVAAMVQAGSGSSARSPARRRTRPKRSPAGS